MNKLSVRTSENVPLLTSLTFNFSLRQMLRAGVAVTDGGLIKQTGQSENREMFIPVGGGVPLSECMK